MPKLHLAKFKVDVTVPRGHSLCGGWIKPAESVSEPLYALGVVLLGGEAPVVLCAVDWTGICNDAHVLWRAELARAAHTTPERVAVHSVHQHNAPFADLTGQRLVGEQPGLPPVLDVAWHKEAVARVAEAVRAALGRAEPVTHVGTGRAAVEKVASNRRIIGPEGKLVGWRGSSCKDEKLRALPEGLIDPYLRTVSLWNGDRKLAALHYYATHPMSYYGDGVVTSDFVGLAREERAREDGAHHVYFTGCAGNIAAGKYNDGSKDNRPVLAARVLAALRASEAAVERRVPGGLVWRTQPVVLPYRSDETEAGLRATLADGSKPVATRNRAALKLSYRLRAAAGTPIVLSALSLARDVILLHLPAEAFIEYQFAAQDRVPRAFLATAAYGDGGPWYIPTVKAYAEGGYEPSAAFVDPEADALLRDGIAKVLG
jgi:hypothetical protein